MKIIIYILPDYIQVWMLLHFLRSVIKELWKKNYYDDMNNSNDADAFRMTSGNPRFFKCRDESVKSNRMRK